MLSRRSSWFTLGLLAAALLWAAAPAAAQQTGAVTGTVMRQSNMQPLEAAQVVVVGTGLGTITDAQGQFRITEVPAGEQRVRVQLVGYGSRTQTVTVEAGQATTVDFELRQSAVELDEIVVTGTGTEGIQRKRLGNTVGSITTENLENSPTASVGEVLAGREEGVQVLPSSGLAGEGMRIRIRGSSSLSQSNSPIVYVDGVRVSSGSGFAGGADAGSLGGGSSSRLDDINPASIARIEILKGAAAATLYGTEASNGVIQIFTKSGREGETRWTLEVENSLERMPTGRLIPHADFPRNSTQAQRMSQRWNESVEPFEVIERNILEDVDETGRATSASLSVNGGGEGITYFGSGRLQNHDGPFGLESLGPARDKNERLQGTVNLNIFPSDEVRVQVRSNYTETEQEAPSTANNIYGVWPMMFHSQLRLANCSDHDQACNFYGTPIFATPEEAMQQVTEQEVQHFGGSAQVTLQPSNQVTLSGTFGADITSEVASEQQPFGWNVDDFVTSNTTGLRDIGSEDVDIFTAELRGGWETEFSDFSSSLTLGAQGFIKQQQLTGGQGADFAGPGLEVASAGSRTILDESFFQNTNVGVFAQEQVGFREVAYLTGGLRLDANSAFGEEFNAVAYPKVSFSVIPSDMSGWNSSVLSTFRIRGAWGQSGLQPGAFDKFRTFNPLTGELGAGLEPGNLGNPELKPEVSTELEGGVELGLFNDRISASATYWTRKVSDALVQKQFPVTGGFSSLQLTNVAEMEASGLDLSVDGSVYRGEDVSVTMFANAAYLTEEITDMGGAPRIKAGGSYPRDRNFLREGFAPGAFFGAEVQDVAIPLDLAGNCTQPTQQEALEYFSQPRNLSDFEVLPKQCGSPAFLDQYQGKPTPDWQGSVGADVSFLENFQLRTMFEYKAGNFYHHDLSGAFRQANSIIGRNTPATARIASTVLDPASSAQERLDAAVEWANKYRALAPMSGMNQIWPADFIRWRELSLTYDTPASLHGALGLRSLSISARARNVALWVNDKYRGIDPELEEVGPCDSVTGVSVDCNFQMGQEAWRFPIPRRFTVAVRAGF